MTQSESSHSLPATYDDNLGGVLGPEALVAFLDVGQGDCTIAADLSERRALVIDCPSWGLQRVRDFIRQHNIISIDSVIITHYDEDHFSGIPQLVREFTPGVLYSNPETLLPDDSSLPKYRAALAAFTDLDERGLIEVQAASRDLTGQFGSIGWRLLAPRRADVMKAMQTARPNRNLASAVVRLKLGPATVIIGGDAPLCAWTRIQLDRPDLLRADVFRASHHGSNLRASAKTINTATLLSSVGASHVGISVGASNTHAHPGLHTVHSARLSGARVLCTQVTPRCLGVPESQQGQDVATERGSVALPSDPYCAGTIRVEVAGNFWRVIPSVSEHASRVDGWSNPHCRLNCRPNGSSLRSPTGCPP
ncbi:MAG: MBL fold metallo-hydrolase [Acidobacteriaceae bacterium]|nr:MBL fold metallo-hydrolase [Acidobacteriaceae bacterium]MBV9483721.1 MBL fold metallo-hydrolase [Acidobacteriota bacterium]